MAYVDFKDLNRSTATKSNKLSTITLGLRNMVCYVLREFRETLITKTFCGSFYQKWRQLTGENLSGVSISNQSQHLLINFMSVGRDCRFNISKNKT